MSRMLTVRSVANVAVALVALVLLAGLALAVSGDDGAVTFTNTAQEDDAGEEPGDRLDNRPGDRGDVLRRCRPHRGPVRHAIHGELIVPERPEGEEETESASFQTVVFDAGEVVEVSDDSLTLQRPDGESVTVRLGDDTRMRDDAPEAGDTVRVVADDDGNARAVHTKRESRPESRPERCGGIRERLRERSENLENEVSARD